MARQLNLRQVEAFKAVIEHGTVSRAAEVMNVSQPAISKLVAHLEEDTSLRLFERVKGRLAPTPNGMRLYSEVDRIFAGLRQVENAVETIRRDEQGRLLIGVMPALSGSFIERSTTAFLARQPGVFCSVQSRSSQWITEGIVDRKLDVGLVIAPIDNPYTDTEPMMGHPVVFIAPLDHPLAAKSVIRPEDLIGQPFISFDPESHTSLRTTATLKAHGVVPNTVMVVNVSPTLCEFVAAGAGVSLVHPLIVGGLRDKLAIRRFEPAIQLDFYLCRVRDSRNARLVDAFLEAAREVAAEISHSMPAMD
ncbi:LysR family transcriptional regulator [Bosea thiooxidans]|uniref:DNA-binding transcriptional regulator, LysR family n=1 Tax=Bosea thiooxidans TaxID=53254 RepID=A0A0Q3SZ85_9HYPH|nr:LysR substrate-binding domain-containing protein [Bosea thiooxidans]KQK30698.1 LysR family transcriptional regulator [Bosea thiooxidans]SKC08700.1 DNA-binding transcriptional regulator, LysR family [Bosea thiooxidans]